MKNLLLALVFATCFSGCKRKESQRAVLHIPPAQMASFGEKPFHIEAGAQLESFVGRRVELEGTVSETPVQQIQGVDLWGLEQFRGKRLLVSGVLQCTEVSSNDVGAIRAQDSGIDGFIAPVYRGTGTFYRLQYLVYSYSRVGLTHAGDELMKNIILFLGIFACLAGYADSPTPEDLLGKAYWDTLDIKSKPVFLMGFRHGAGLNTFGTTNLTLNEHEIPKIVPLIDSFYKVTDNRGAYLRSAIEICLMKLLDKPQAEIEKLTKKARTPKIW